MAYVRGCARVLRYTSTWRPGYYVRYGKTVTIVERFTVAGILKGKNRVNKGRGVVVGGEGGGQG
jgi:hypothetical protein